LTDADERQRELEKQLAELDQKQSQLLQKTANAEKAVKTASVDKQKAEKEAQEA